MLNNIRSKSNNYTLDPPERVWGRLEYKLERFELKKQERSKGRLIFISSAAAVIVIITGIIGLIRSEVRIITTNEKSEIIIEDNNNTYKANEAYNVHDLMEYYNRLNTTKYRNPNTELEVNNNI
ncbi:MAG: hypothetical protein ACM3PT_07765 [Deltaproteobacteria bacterium]